ncbi:MAG: hypothetical protein WA734_00035 [Candidatus Acidiferrales bacterium]
MALLQAGALMPQFIVREHQIHPMTMATQEGAAQIWYQENRSVQYRGFPDTSLKNIEISVKKLVAVANREGRSMIIVYRTMICV